MLMESGAGADAGAGDGNNGNPDNQNGTGTTTNVQTNGADNSEPKGQQAQDDNGSGNPNGQQTNANQTAFDVSKEFEGFNDLAQVKEFVNRARQIGVDNPEKFNEIQQKLSQIEQIQKEVEQYKNFNPYKNEIFYKLDKLAEDENEKPFLKLYNEYHFGDPSDLKIVEMGELMKNYNVYKDNPQALERRLRNKYPALFDESIDKEDDEYQDALLNVKLDAEETRRFIDKKFAQIKIPEKASVEDNEQQQKEFAESWKPEIVNIKESLKTFPVTIQDDADPTKEIKVMDLPISEGEAGELLKTAANFIVSNKLNPTKENVELAKQAALGAYLVKNFSKIQTALAKQIEQETGVKWRSKLTNPQRVNPKEDVINNSGQGSNVNDILQDITGGYMV